MTKQYHNEAWLRQKHEVEMLSINQIASICGVGNAAIRRFMKKFGIKSRSPSEGCKLRWQDDEFRQRATNAIRKSCSDPTVRANMTAASRKMWSDSELRAKHQELMNSDEYRSKQSASQKRRMQRPDQLAKASQTLRRCWSDDQIRQRRMESYRKTISDPEYRRRLSERMKLRYTDQEYRRRFSAIMKKAFMAADIRLKLSINTRLLWQSREYRDKITESSKRLWQRDDYRAKQAALRLNYATTSILEDIIKSALADRGIMATQEQHGPWTFDIGFENNGRKILIECQGTYWHSRPGAITRDKQKKTYFDRYLADRHELYYIYEHEFYGLNKINQLIDIILGVTIPVRDFSLADAVVSVASGDDRIGCRALLDRYHYLSHRRSGLFVQAKIGETLIATCLFGGISRLQTADSLNMPPNQMVELSRFCVHPEYQQRNLASWFLARAVKLLPNSIKMAVSFSDVAAGHTGTIYRAAGWQPAGSTSSSYWYLDSLGSRYHKKTVWDQAKRMQMTELEYCNLVGLVKIHGGQVMRFIKDLR